MRRVAMVGASLLAISFVITACQKKTDAAATGDAAPTTATALAPAGPPKLKAGYWTQSFSSEGRTQEIRLCLDQATVDKMSVWGQQTSGQRCAKNSFSRTPTGWAFEAECDMDSGGKQTTKGTITGDVASNYTMTATTSVTGSGMPQADGVHEMSMTAVRADQCPADMKPGDVAMPGGIKVNLAEIDALRGKSGK